MLSNNKNNTISSIRHSPTTNITLNIPTNMSLREVYTLAHHAQARLNQETRRPDRSLRFMVGHLAHCESLRLRINDMENAISQSQHASTVAFKGTGSVVDYTFKHTGRKSPPPPSSYDDEEEEEEDEDDYAIDDDEDDLPSLGLMRCASHSPYPIAPPELDFDDSDESEGDSESDSDSDSDSDDDEVSFSTAQPDSLATCLNDISGPSKPDVSLLQLSHFDSPGGMKMRPMVQVVS